MLQQGYIDRALRLHRLHRPLSDHKVSKGSTLGIGGILRLTLPMHTKAILIAVILSLRISYDAAVLTCRQLLYEVKARVPMFSLMSTLHLIELIDASFQIDLERIVMAKIGRNKTYGSKYLY